MSKTNDANNVKYAKVQYLRSKSQFVVRMKDKNRTEVTRVDAVKGSMRGKRLLRKLKQDLFSNQNIVCVASEDKKEQKASK